MPLLEGNQVPEGHRDERQGHEQGHPERVFVNESHEHQLEQPRESGGGRRDAQERRHRHGRSLVRVRSPELERNGTDLEGEPHHHEEDGRVGEGLLRPG